MTQEADGHWPQNMWLDGSRYWDGIQLDETALPILLVNLAKRDHALSTSELSSYWPMVRKAASFILRNGPVTQEDRWEEDPGYSPFTLAAEVAALIVAADLAEQNNEAKLAVYLREVADNWNTNIERWTYVSGTELAQKFGVDGYYVRIAPPEEAEAASPASGFVPIKNRPGNQSEEPAAHIVSPDALALVRFGLRSADDPRILDTIKIVNSLLKVDTPFGPAWHRYNDDGYGEHEDGSPFDGTGIGRAWPLLTGERAHYELAAGHLDEAQNLLNVLKCFANEGGLISEQIWDAPDLPDKELYFGRPSGSAMPLVWAHSEYIKLCRSIKDGFVFDMPKETFQRYVTRKVVSTLSIWRFNCKIRSMPAGNNLRIELFSPAVVHWSSDQWATTHDNPTIDTGVGVYWIELSVSDLPNQKSILFSLNWQDPDRWEGQDYEVGII